MASTETKSPQEHLSEIFELTKSYALQETVDPLKGLLKFVGFGLGAAVLGGTGVILILIGVLRVLQNETGEHLTGSLTWVPYLITLVVAAVCILIAVLAITRKKGSRI